MTDQTPSAYRTVVADPPWPYDGRDAFAITVKKDGTRAIGTGLNRHYAPMSMEALAALQVPAGENAHLYLWTTNAFMVEAHALARAWGFEPKTICTWVKTHQGDAERVSMKTGYYFRGATEHFLFCVRGSLRLKDSAGALPTAFLWPRQPHSVKPEAFYDLVESASFSPYLELFARRNRLGWDTWGDQALEHVEVGA
jgi:N6-adenosine-specific RNA methylase IME4